MYPDSIINELSKRTPWVIMEPGRIIILGRSIPENPGSFYRPIEEWVSMYASDYKDESKILLGFEYINTSSTKWIYTILKELSVMKDISNKAKVKWYYEQGDDDMCELGIILSSMLKCPFDIIEVDDMNVKRYEDIVSDTHY